jgi:DNA-binding NarL/FixJ family response regulator
MLADVPGTVLAGEGADATKAFDDIQRLAPEVAIVDLRMPGDGIHLVRRLKSMEQGPVVIVLTNYASPPYRTRALLAGADYFLDKSVDQTELVRILQSMSTASGTRPS